MKNLVILSALAGLIGVALPAASASAEEHRRCRIERTCHWEHHHKVCKVVRVCHDHDHHH